MLVLVDAFGCLLLVFLMTQRFGVFYVLGVEQFIEVPIILHTDHCAKKMLPWFDGLGEPNDEYFEKYCEPLFEKYCEPQPAQLGLVVERFEKRVPIRRTSLRWVSASSFQIIYFKGGTLGWFVGQRGVVGIRCSYRVKVVPNATRFVTVSYSAPCTNMACLPWYKCFLVLFSSRNVSQARGSS
jgi:hypothetical protein